MSKGLQFSTNIPVNLWNVIKFVFVEIILSLVLAQAWDFFARRSASSATDADRVVQVRSYGLGRFTPAEVFWHERDSRRSAVLAQILVVTVNLLLLSSLLTMEYGSTSSPAKKRREIEVIGARSSQLLNEKQKRGNYSSRKSHVPVLPDDCFENNQGNGGIIRPAHNGSCGKLHADSREAIHISGCSSLEGRVLGRVCKGTTILGKLGLSTDKNYLFQVSHVSKIERGNIFTQRFETSYLAEGFFYELGTSAGTVERKREHAIGKRLARKSRKIECLLVEQDLLSKYGWMPRVCRVFSDEGTFFFFSTGKEGRDLYEPLSTKRDREEGSSLQAPKKDEIIYFSVEDILFLNLTTLHIDKSAGALTYMDMYREILQRLMKARERFNSFIIRHVVDQVVLFQVGYRKDLTYLTNVELEGEGNVARLNIYFFSGLFILLATAMAIILRGLVLGRPKSCTAVRLGKLLEDLHARDLHNNQYPKKVKNGVLIRQKAY